MDTYTVSKVKRKTNWKIPSLLMQSNLKKTQAVFSNLSSYI